MSGNHAGRADGFHLGWRFTPGDRADGRLVECDDTGWEEVVIPHTWNADDMRPGRPENEAYIGPAWYRKRFRVPDRGPGDRVFLRFEAVANFCNVWVDGNYVGGRDGGFLPFRLDITPALAEGEEHVVAVRVDNAPRPDSVPPDPIDWERFGGIYRPVHLETRPGIHFDFPGVFIRTPKVSRERAEISVTARIRACETADAPLSLVHRVLDPAGEEVSRAETQVVPARGRSVDVTTDLPSIATPRLWSPDSPALYSVESVLSGAQGPLDCAVNPLGLRWFEFDADDGFSLNGIHMKLCGVNIHQEYMGLGNACPPRVFEKDVRLLKEAGINFIRASHYPRHDHVLALCDGEGIMVMEEQAFWHGSVRSAGQEPLLYNSRRLVREMVEHHGNHPCIIAWNTVNEIMLTPVKGEPHPDPEVRKRQHWLQPDEWPFALRVVEAMNDELHRADPSRPVSVVVGGQWEANERAGITKLADIVCYNGGAVHDIRDGKPSYDLCKEHDPGRISMMSEGVLNDVGCERADWEGELVNWKRYAEHWSRFYERKWFCGGAMWVYADYSAKGTYRTRGLVDAFRLPYESFYFFRSQWHSEPMIHICGHWDWPQSVGKKRCIAVFTNAEEAELFVNGKSLGKRRPDRETWPHLPHPPMQWTAVYEPGEIAARACRDGDAITDSRTTSAVPERIVLTPETPRIHADGVDAGFIRATIVDAAGNRCWRVNTPIEVEVDGRATLAGPTDVHIRGGLGMITVRAGCDTGTIDLRARGADLRAAQVRITAV